MYLSSICFKRTRESEWEKGYYVGEDFNSTKSIILDKDFKPIECDEDGCSVWDYRNDVERGIIFQCKS